MEKTMKVEGMKCVHCEARVKKALEAVEGVSAAIVNKDNGSAVVTASEEVTNETLTAAVTEAGYKVLSVE
ncbi:MAG: cation transporter [Eubacteriales bacterium]|nr:cation transporter [Eubacteriales bacterium]